MFSIPCILNVAEKPSVAKEVTFILSGKKFSSIRSDSQYNPVYEFDITFQAQPAKMNFTSVTGHIMNCEFPPNYKDWKSVDPKVLLREAPVNKTVCEDKMKLASNLKRLSRNANILVLWLDCDAEGEAIAYEVIEICQETNRNLKILRAHFSAITSHDINHAFNNLKEPNKRLAESIEARQEIDLRVGASFTRFQTLTLQPRFSSLNSNLISYGPCQIPTLGFVVERYKKVKNFVPETFWYIFCKYESRNGSHHEYIEFSWMRNRLYDEYCSRLLYEKCLEKPEALVMKVETRPKSKWRPSPLNTIELQKLASRKLHMSSSRVMEIAEKLYNKGFISYPRTETDSFLKSINLKEFIGYQVDNNEWGEYASNLLSNQSTNTFLWPRNGPHNDNAHPPIHPSKVMLKTDATTEEWKVYELVTRHFLACCSQDAKGQEKLIEIMINEEEFFAKGILITEYNYLQVYIYDKWTETNLPNLNLNQKFIPTELLLKEGKTTAPSLLSEADLIATMDKNGIGTDATIAEHIKTIQERGYAEKINGAFFSPTNLGLALVESYEQMGLELAKPKLRAEMEKKMKEIVAGRKNKSDVIRESVTAMEEVYIQISSQRSVFIENVRKFYREDHGEDEERKEEEVDLGLCKECQRNLVLMKGQFFRGLKCRNCDILMQLPKQGELTKVNFLCPLCKSQVINVKTEKNTTYYLCPWCINNPPNDFEDVLPDKSPSKFNSNMPCFKCPNQACQYASGWLNRSLFICEKCGKSMKLKKTKNNKYFCGCSGYPNCKNSAFLPDLITECRPQPSSCQRCKNKNIISSMVELKFSESDFIPMGIQVILSMEPNGAMFCLLPGCNQYLEEMGYQYSRNSTEEEHKGSGQRNGGNDNQKNICFKCGKKGHFANNCTSKQQGTLNNYFNKTNENNNQNQNNSGRTFKNENRMNIEERSNSINGAGRERSHNEGLKNAIKCFKCGEEGHYANSCPRNFSVPNNRGGMNSTNFANNKNNGNHTNNNNFNRGNNNSNNFGNDKIKCYQCGQEGHLASTCSSEVYHSNNFQNNYENNQNNNNFSKNSIVCFKCKEPGHIAPNCPNGQKQDQSKRNYNQIKNEKNTKEKKGCKICGVARHTKNSTCPGIKKRKKKDFTDANEEGECDNNEDEN